MRKTGIISAMWVEAEKLHMAMEQDTVKEYEYRSNTRLGKLVANRELPVLYRAKEMIDSGI